MEIATPISNKLPYASTRFAGTSATIGLNDTIRNTVVQKEKCREQSSMRVFRQDACQGEQCPWLEVVLDGPPFLLALQIAKEKDIAELS